MKRPQALIRRGFCAICGRSHARPNTALCYGSSAPECMGLRRPRLGRPQTGSKVSRAISAEAKMWSPRSGGLRPYNYNDIYEWRSEAFMQARSDFDFRANVRAGDNIAWPQAVGEP